MKSLSSLIACLSLALVLNVSSAEPAKDAKQQEQQVLALVKDIQAQQATIAENQAKMDAKLVVIAEAVRQAKIYSSRGGK